MGLKPKAALAKLKKRKHPAGCQCQPCVKRRDAVLRGGLWRDLAQFHGELAEIPSQDFVSEDPKENPQG